jgi:hypothetical protein
MSASSYQRLAGGTLESFKNGRSRKITVSSTKPHMANPAAAGSSLMRPV